MIFILNGFLIIANVFGAVTFVAIALDTNCDGFESCLIGRATTTHTGCPHNKSSLPPAQKRRVSKCRNSSNQT